MSFTRGTGPIGLLLALALAACEGGAPPQVDAGSVDATAQEDAEPLDAGPEDVDRDGVPAAVDCDDADATVGREHTEPCETACGAGEVTCADGARGECNAPTDCLCTVGDVRMLPCRRCGTGTQRCVATNDWRWDAECADQGECDAGATEEQSVPMCGRQMRTCTDECAWSEWVDVVPPGVCERGEITHCEGGATFVCPSDCTAPTWCTVCPRCG